MERSDAVDRQAESLFRAAKRSERLWPAGVVVLALYLASCSWSFTRALGGTDQTATVRALPNVWVPIALVGIVVGGKVLAKLAEDSGGSPFWWPRQARRVLVGLAFALPVLLFAVEPLLVITSVDAGRSDPITLGDWLVRLDVTLRP